MIQVLENPGHPTVLVESTAAKEVAAVGVWYRRGSRDEDATSEGAVHFVEHMLFKGTSSKTASDIARSIDRLGGGVNAFTEKEAVCLYAVVPSDDFSQAAELLIDLVNASSFDTVEFERERNVIESELLYAEDDPEESATDGHARFLWGPHELGAPIGGTSSQVHNLSFSLVRDLYSNSFAKKAGCISVAGGVDIEVAREAFDGAFGEEVPPSRSFPEPLIPRSRFQYESSDNELAQVFFSFQLPERLDDSSYYAAAIANSAAGDSAGSRLFQGLRERRGLCYSVSSSFSLYSDRSLWTAYAACVPDKLDELLQALGNELAQLRDEGIDDQEVAFARAHVRGGVILSSADVEHRMRALARRHLAGFPTLEREEATRMVESVTSKEADHILKRYTEAAPALYCCGPQSSRKRALKTMEHVLGASSFGTETSYGN